MWALGTYVAGGQRHGSISRRTKTNAGKQLHNETQKMRLLSMRTLGVWVALLQACAADDVWEKDMSNEIYIEASHEGFHHVKLK